MEDQYLAGLWCSYIPAGLLWRRLVATKGDILLYHPMRYRAPSWSWASIDGEIEYGWPERMDGCLECTRLDHKESIASIVGIEVIEAGIELARADKPFGAVKSGFIEASGMVSVVRGDLKPGYHEEKGQFFRLGVQDDFKRPQTIDCWPDTDERLPQPYNELWLLALTGAAEDVGDGHLSTSTHFVIRGLLLIPVSESNFRRVGFFESRNSYDEVLMSGFEKRTITLL